MSAFFFLRERLFSFVSRIKKAFMVKYLYEKIVERTGEI